MNTESTSPLTRDEQDLAWFFNDRPSFGLRSSYPMMIQRLLVPGEVAPKVRFEAAEDALLDTAARAHRIRRALEAAGPEVATRLERCFTGPASRALKALGPGGALAPLLPEAAEAHRRSRDTHPLEEWLERLPQRAQRKPDVRPVLERLSAATTTAREGALAAYREARRRLALPASAPEAQRAPPSPRRKTGVDAERWMSNEDRFHAQVEEDQKTGCWRWTGATGAGGVPRFAFRSDGVSPRPVVSDAQTWAFEHFLRPLPKGHVAATFCRRRNCVSPEHLVAISLEMAALLKRELCSAGHRYEVRNLLRTPQGPVCRRCHLAGTQDALSWGDRTPEREETFTDGECHG
jgi:hypothetical protein